MSGPQTPPESGPSSFTPPVSPPPPKRSKGALIAIAAIVIVILVVLALFLAGVIPGLKSSSSTGPSGRSYDVTFTETGLPSGTSWSATLAGSTQSSTTASVVFSEKNGSYSFTIGSVTGFAASPASGSVTVNGANISKAIAFATGYAVTFTESGLASGTSWSVTLNGTMLSSSTGSIVFTVVNGVYSYTVGSVTGYTAAPASGSVTVSSAAQTVPIAFTAVAGGKYSVTFSESGLPASTSWSVTLGGSTLSSTTTTIVFSESNNSYSYSIGAVTGYTSSPSSGTITVAGVAQTVSIVFMSSSTIGGPAYLITFDQTGLPSTDLWGVDALRSSGGTDLIFGQTTTGPSTNFAIPDGTYLWTVDTSVSGYAVVPSYGNLTVAGAPVTIHVVFEQGYDVNFTESGLSSLASWSVTLNGSSSSAIGTENNTFVVPNGTYPFTASAFGYSASPASGHVTVAGANITQAIAFTALTSYPVTFTETGLTAGTYWYVDLNGTFNSSYAPNSVTFSVPNGAYPYTVGAAGYSASPASGTVTVSSSGQTVATTFTGLVTYTVTFTETGLTSGTVWSVDLNLSYNFSTAPNPVTFHVPNGVYDFAAFATGYSASPATGTVTVSSVSQTVAITFTALPPVQTYNVTFLETGLPAFSYWEVDLVSNGPYLGADYSCSNSTFGTTSVNCTVANGHYSWEADTDTANFSASPMSGWIVVNGAAQTVDVSFVNTSADYIVWFAEEWYAFSGVGGLPNGSSWSVTVGGTTQSTEGMWLFFFVPNGTTASYSITPPSGYAVVPSAGNVTGWGNIYQSFEFSFLSPHVLVVFGATDPPGGGGAPANTLTALGAGPVAMATRDLPARF